ncbi:MAG: nitroreductase family protein [Dehalococcoidia bacterium]|jgi:nitroreductase
MELMDALKGRRSIRKYKPDPVSDKDIELLLEAARWAPSWANMQVVRWIVVRDRDTKMKLAETLSSTNPANEAMRTVPVVLVLCAETGRVGFKKGAPVTDKGDWWFMFDAALAVQNLTLMAYALGLGTVNIGYLDAKKAEQILQMPANARIVELIPLGYPNEQPRGPGRKELAEIVYHEKYGQR